MTTNGGAGASPSLSVRVARKWVEAVDIAGFDLESVDGQALPAFSAGSHIDVHLPNGVTRQYSLCNPAAERDRYVIAVLREPVSRGGSKALHDTVREGDTLAISPPRNHFALAHAAERHLLFAGGIGITPILSMAERLATTGGSFNLHYCARSPSRAAFRARVLALGPRAAFHLDDGDAAQQLDLADRLANPAPGTHLYVCGPKGFMDAVLQTARAAGWPESVLHVEYFAGTATPSDADAAFTVRLASTGQLVPVSRGESVADALAEAGVTIATSCGQGVCGTCITRVLEGIPDHRDLYLTPEEQALNDQFTPCCSRSRSAVLVLDL